MSEYSQSELHELIGRVPSGGIPAAWWITTDAGQLAAYEQYQQDFDERRVKVEALANALGLTADKAMMSSWGNRSELTGFAAPHGMLIWDSHPDHIPTPEGWRIDRKKDYLVPKRKSKADRESQANKDFAAIRTIPIVGAYLTGLPSEIWLPGAIYTIQYRRGDACIMAFSGADPDRSEDKLTIDTNIWHRQKLSALIAMRENATAS